MSEQYFTTREDEDAMVKEMCSRVHLSHLAGRFILSMCRIWSSQSIRRSTQADMVLVARLIKYASEHKSDLRPRFHMGNPGTVRQEYQNKANFTFLK